MEKAGSTELILNWEFINPRSGETIPLGEKGSVQEGLIAAGVLPDPFYGMNEEKFGWIEEYRWTFNSHFELPKEMHNSPFIDLDFPSLDTYAEVYINDELVLSAENAFRPYHINAKSYLRAGQNHIRIVFTPPVMYHAERYKNADYHFPAPNDVHQTPVAPYSRKPQYQFGWDWALRINTIGLNKAARLLSYPVNEVMAKNIQTLEVSEGKARLRFQWVFRQKVEGIVNWNSDLFGNLNYEAQGNTLTAEVEVEQPRLWWPRGQGEAFLYRDKWELTIASGKNVAAEPVQYGIRTTELIKEKDAWGTSYYMKINGVPVFCKGGDYIPQDIFPARVTDAQLESMVEQLYTANFNMVRIWGGGYYPDEAFYKACDEKGIMVWQDFMFACAMYPGDDPFLANVKEEIDYQIPRISSHPSVVLFNGNNEVDVAWKNWGFQIRYNLYGKSAKAIEKAYDDLFKKLIPDEVSRFCNVPYVHTSPLSNWGKDEHFNHGSQHYWGVWHGKDPIEDFGRKIGRFNAEYGFQSFPEFSTLFSFAEPTDWNLNSDVMKQHQKSYVGNGMIEKHATILYGPTKDFNRFVYYSQLTQAKAVGMAVAGHRLDWPRCGGTLYWQVNDCWPAPTWSGIDYYGNWKALHYQVQDDFRDVAVLAREQKPYEFEFFLISDQHKAFECEVVFTLYSIDGKWLESHTFMEEVTGIFRKNLPLEQLIQQLPEEYVLHIRWNDQHGAENERTVARKTKTPMATGEHYQLRLEVDPSTRKQVLILDNTQPLIDCWITGFRHAIRLRTNFETLLPGTHRIELEADEELTLEDILIFYR